MAESVDRPKSLDRQIRAFRWIRTLAELPGRLAGSAEEREAAECVASWLRELGLEDVSVTPVSSRPRTGIVLAVHLGLGALGAWLGGGLGALLAGLAAWSFRRELREATPLLTRRLPAPDSVNVVGRVGPPAAGRRVVLSAHLDSAQAGWVFSPALAQLFVGWARPDGHRPAAPRGPLVLPEALLLAGAALSVATWLGAEGWLLGFARFGVGAGLVLGCAAALQWAWAEPTPGANDNASAVAAMLTCAEQLLSQLPDDVELWLVAAGAEEVGCRGMRAFVESHRDWSLDSTYFVNFECVGGGALHFVKSEGTLAKTTYPPLLLELARRVAASSVFGEITPAHLVAATDGHVPAARGYPALSIISLEASGVPRNYHLPEDAPESLDMETVVRAADFGAAVAQAALRGEAGPISIL